MKRLLAPLPGTAAVLAASLLISVTAASGAPKKTQPAPAAQAAAAPLPAPPPPPVRKGIFTKARETLGLKKKEQPAALPQTPAPPSATAKAAPKAKVAPAPVPVAAPEKTVTKKAAPPATQTVAARTKAVPQPVVQEAPAKKGWLKGLFTKSKQQEAPAEPQLAKAKTAKPAPVKEVKPIKPDAALTVVEQPAPREKRGLFGFIRKLREPVNDASDMALDDAGKIERPDDWQDHKVVTEDSIGVYSFGPMQSNGPDRRLSRGAVVKVKSVRRGWALVEVNGGFAGYMDASALRDADKSDFREPPPPTMMASVGNPDYWAPLAPPPDLPDQPSKLDSGSALLLLPPLELEPKPNP